MNISRLHAVREEIRETPSESQERRRYGEEFEPTNERRRQRRRRLQSADRVDIDRPRVDASEHGGVPQDEHQRRYRRAREHGRRGALPVALQRSRHDWNDLVIHERHGDDWNRRRRRAPIRHGEQIIH